MLQNEKFKMYYVLDAKSYLSVYAPQAADVSTLTFLSSYRGFFQILKNMFYLRTSWE